MAKLIKRLVAGQTPSLLNTEKGNELIDQVNAILQMQVNPQGFGKLTLGDKNLILDLTQIRDLINQLSTQVSAFSQTTGGGGGGGGGSGGTSTLVINTINGIITGLQGATLALACDPDTRVITGTLTINLPPTI